MRYTAYSISVPPNALEPLPPAPEAGALSTELRGQVATLCSGYAPSSTHYIVVSRSNAILPFSREPVQLPHE
jgi:hypothetical protein